MEIMWLAATVSSPVSHMLTGRAVFHVPADTPSAGAFKGVIGKCSD